MAATIRLAPRFGVENTQPLFAVPEIPGNLGNSNYAVTPDGQRFLIRVENPASPVVEIQVVLNWFEELRERVAN